MAKTLLEKMFLKLNYSVAMLHVPTGLEKELISPNRQDTSLSGEYQFILGFFTKKEDLEKEISTIKETLQKDGLLWIAYPKAKALQTDLNRDVLHQTLKDYSLDGVSLVSLNDTWSAMRFKKI